MGGTGLELYWECWRGLTGHYEASQVTHRTKLGGDRPGGNTDLHVPRDPTTSLLSWPSGPSLMEGSGRKVFFLRKHGKREVSDGKTPGASFGAHVGYLESRLGVGGRGAEAQINKALEFPSGLRQFLAGPRFMLAGRHWQNCF